MRSILVGMALLAILEITFIGNVRAEEKAVPLNKLPKVVSDAVKKLYPKAKMVEASQEEEDGKIEYEVTISENGKKIEVSVEADGKIDSLEKEIDLTDLPKAITEALKKSHPKALAKSAEAVYEIEDGKEELEYYEVLLKAADGNEVELKFKSDGSAFKDEDDEKDSKAKK